MILRGITSITELLTIITECYVKKAELLVGAGNFPSSNRCNMSAIVKLETVSQYNTMRGVTTSHAVITVVDLSQAKPMCAKSFEFVLYAI